MGQKVNPHGIRVGVIKDWDSRWFAKDNAFGDILVDMVSNVSYLQAFRQLSLPLGVAMGIIFLHEKFTVPKVIGVIMIVIGLIMTVI